MPPTSSYLYFLSSTSYLYPLPLPGADLLLRLPLLHLRPGHPAGAWSSSEQVPFPGQGPSPTSPSTTSSLRQQPACAGLGKLHPGSAQPPWHGLPQPVSHPAADGGGAGGDNQEEAVQEVFRQNIHT